MSELTQIDVVGALHKWIGQAQPTLELNRGGRQAIASWVEANWSRVQANWDAHKWQLRTGIHAMADYMAAVAVEERRCKVAGTAIALDGISFLEGSTLPDGTRTPFCP